MSCGCETREVCMGGRTYNVHIQLDPRGNFVSGVYLDENLVNQTLAAGTFQWGACAVQTNDVRRFVQPLVVGNNIITHLLGFAPVEVEVRNNSTGALISARVVAETTNTVTINVPVAVASARISIDA